MLYLILCSSANMANTANLTPFKSKTTRPIVREPGRLDRVSG